MSLDPQAQALLQEAIAAKLSPVYMLSVEAARERMRGAFMNAGQKLEIESVQDRFIPGPGYRIGVRVYSPYPSRVLPGMLFFHGGGWTLNDLDTHDILCRALSKHSEIVVVSVDYRRAPEFKYPVANEDAYSAFLWTYFNAVELGIDPRRIAVGGDSSGGTQAAVICHLNRDRSGPKIAFQWLAYPVTDYYLPGTPSYLEVERGYSMNRDFMIWFWNNFLPQRIDLADPYLFPLRAANFANLPRAFIMTAQYDPLRDEGEAYGERLATSGIPVRVQRYEDQMHGFLMQRHRIDNAQSAFIELVDEIKDALQ